MIPKLIQDKTITNIKTDLYKSLTFSDTNNINERLQYIHKFVRDGINPNINIPLESSVTSEETTWQKRRFSKHNEINRDQNDTVVNLSSPVKMALCQLTYTTNRQINISTCPHRVVILSIAPKVFRTAKPSESNATAPMNKLPNKRLGELKCHLKKRGYNNASINHCFNKASGIDRKDLIQYKEKKTNNRVSFVITYHPALSNLSNIVREHWTTIQKHPELCKIFKEPPVWAFRKPKRLKDILVRADISPRSAYNGQCQKCDSRRCTTCKNIQCIHKSSSTHTGKECIIYCNANCKTENIIYLLECAICGLLYIGETKQQLSKRLNGHKRCKLQT